MPSWLSPRVLSFALGVVSSAIEVSRGEGGTPRTVQIAQGVLLLRDVLDRHAALLDEEVREQVRTVVDAGLVQGGRGVEEAVRAVVRSPGMAEQRLVVARLVGWSSRWRGSGR